LDCGSPQPSDRNICGRHQETLDDQHPDGWIPEEKLSLEEAIRSYTVRAAYAEFSEDEKGTLEPGKLADWWLSTGTCFASSRMK